MKLSRRNMILSASIFVAVVVFAVVSALIVAREEVFVMTMATKDPALFDSRVWLDENLREWEMQGAEIIPVLEDYFAENARYPDSLEEVGVEITSKQYEPDGHSRLAWGYSPSSDGSGFRLWVGIDGQDYPSCHYKNDEGWTRIAM